jgi:hypothetical protein
MPVELTLVVDLEEVISVAASRLVLMATPELILEVSKLTLASKLTTASRLTQGKKWTAGKRTLVLVG